MSNAYLGSAVLIRRSTDNATQNIGFDGNGDLDTTSLKTFVGAGDGFVAIWYDQSGNGTDLTQPIVTRQPRLVGAGIIERERGKPFMRFFKTNDFNSLTLPYEITENGHVIAVNKFALHGDGFILAHSNSISWHSNPPQQLFIDYANSAVKGGKIWQNGEAINYSNAVFNTKLMINSVAQVDPTLNTAWDNIGADRIYHYTNNGGGYAELITFTNQLSNADRMHTESNQYAYFLENVVAITKNPSTLAQTVPVGESGVTLTVAASGEAPTYQWYKNTESSNTGGTLLPGEITGNYTPSSSITGTLYYYADNNI